MIRAEAQTDLIRVNDGATGPQGPQGETGAAGESISTITNYYLATAASSGVTRETSGWTTTIQTMDSTNQYLWNYEVVVGTKGTTLTTTNPVIIGRYGLNGGTGKGISSITEYYLATSAASGVTVETSGWTTAVQTTDATNKYLWNYEVIAYTTGNPYTSSPRIIGTYGDKGDKGDTPEITASKSGTTTTISVDGTSVATISDGAQGPKGDTPEITATKTSGTTTIKVDGTTVATVDDGAKGDAGVSSTITTSRTPQNNGTITRTSYYDDSTGRTVTNVQTVYDWQIVPLTWINGDIGGPTTPDYTFYDENLIAPESWTGVYPPPIVKVGDYIEDGGYRYTVSSIGTTTVQCTERIKIEGESGKSAYQSAVSGGYTGTEAAFNADLADVSNKAPNTIIREYNSGVLVGKVGQDTGALVNAQGSFDVVGVTWNGDVPTAGNSIASFGEACIVGANNNGRMYLDSSELTFTDKNSEPYFVVKDSTNSSGYKTIQETFNVCKVSGVMAPTIVTPILTSYHVVSLSKIKIGENEWSSDLTNVTVRESLSGIMRSWRSAYDRSVAPGPIEIGDDTVDPTTTVGPPPEPPNGKQVSETEWILDNNPRLRLKYYPNQGGAVFGVHYMPIFEAPSYVVLGAQLYSQLNSTTYQEGEAYTQVVLEYITDDASLKTLTFGTRSGVVNGTGSVCFGTNNKATDTNTFAVGTANQATAKGASVMGQNNIASGISSHAEGEDTTASGYASHAEGKGILTAVVQGTTVIGTGAKGDYSHCEGSYTIASGTASHAEGYGTEANGKYSHASGLNTKAGGNSQTVIGKYNNNNTNNIFEVGVGSATSPKNGFIVDNSGNIMSIGMAGMVQMFAGATPPTGWLLCDGSAVSRTDYAELFAAIGTTWGAGDGSTTFNLPDMRGRAPVGVGQGSGLTNRALAATGGDEHIQAHTHAFTQPKTPNHTHTTDTNRQFVTRTNNSAGIGETGVGSTGTKFYAPSIAKADNWYGVANTASSGGGVACTGGAVGAVSGATTGTAGNMMPFRGINFIIATGKTA